MYYFCYYLLGVVYYCYYYLLGVLLKDLPHGLLLVALGVAVEGRRVDSCRGKV